MSPNIWEEKYFTEREWELLHKMPKKRAIELIEERVDLYARERELNMPQIFPGSGEYPIEELRIPKNIPEFTYHVTPYPRQVMKTGLKPSIETGKKTFGGSGAGLDIPYVSTTDKNNAIKYARALHKMVYFFSRKTIKSKEKALERILTWADRKGCTALRSFIEGDPISGTPSHLEKMRKYTSLRAKGISFEKAEDYAVYMALFQDWYIPCGEKFKMDFPRFVDDVDRAVERMKKIRLRDIAIIQMKVDRKHVTVVVPYRRMKLSRKEREYLKTGGYVHFNQDENEWRWYDWTVLKPVKRITFAPWG